LLAVIPAVARALPRPGVWMDVLKQALAFPMYAAAAWLVWVASLQAGPGGVLACVAGLVLIGFAAWSLRFGARLGRGLAILATITALALLPQLREAPASQATEGSERYTPQHLAELRAAGRPVFVNMTAAWCVTCLINERVALSPAPVQDAFAAAGVAYLKGDWTRQDPDISRFLAEQGRDGVPLYVFFPAGGGPAVVLPQLLTPSIVLGALHG
jgi:thiol:disulfide interchange protein DsbD